MTGIEYLLVVYIFMDDHWIRGDELDGWGSLSYRTQEICLEHKENAEKIQLDLTRVNPRTAPKYFACEVNEIGSNG
ncbi:MAG: hypothetical protein ACE5H8_07805 [Alphaproteobacteria bacterium]